MTNKSRKVLHWEQWNNTIFAGRYRSNTFSFSAVFPFLYLDGVRAEVSFSEVLTCLPKKLHRPAVSSLMQTLSLPLHSYICAWEESWTKNAELIKRSKIFSFIFQIPRKVDKQV